MIRAISGKCNDLLGSYRASRWSTAKNRAVLARLDPAFYADAAVPWIVADGLSLAPWNLVGAVDGWVEPGHDGIGCS